MKGEGYYEKELPEKFRTWVEFYQYVKKQNLHKNFTEVRLAEAPGRELVYKAEAIKDNALEELLSEELNYDEVAEFLEKAKKALWWNGIYRYDDTHAKVTRVLTTILGIKRHERNKGS